MPKKRKSRLTMRKGYTAHGVRKSLLAKSPAKENKHNLGDEEKGSDNKVIFVYPNHDPNPIDAYIIPEHNVTTSLFQDQSLNVGADPLEDIQLPGGNPVGIILNVPIITKCFGANYNQVQSGFFATEEPNAVIEIEDESSLASEKFPQRSTKKQQSPVAEPMLIEAIASGNLPQVQKIVEQGVTLSKREPYGNSPLMLAVKLGHPTIVQYLLANGSALYRDCISQAIEKYQQTCLECLLNSKYADLNQVDTNGFTPLTKAIEYGNVTAATLLIENGADVNVQDTHGDSPLRKCLGERNYDLFQTLVENGANVNEVDSKKGSLLLAAANMKDFTLAAYLIHNGANIEESLAELKQFKQLKR